MSKHEVIDSMIIFIENAEKELQASKMCNDTKQKTDIVNSILNKLEKEIAYEN